MHHVLATITICRTGKEQLVSEQHTIILGSGSEEQEFLEAVLADVNKQLEALQTDGITLCGMKYIS